MPKVIFKIDANVEYTYHKLFREVNEFRDMSLFSWTSIDDKELIIKKITQFWDTEDRKIIKEIEGKWREVENQYF